MSSTNLAHLGWRKSSHSGGQGGNCVEVADLTNAIGIRDSKDPHGPKLVLRAAAWRALAARLKG
ncbi:DUF397 domain-containing protein [Actinomadura macrotermitis]|uniref:DUF397 domain-containing protein n=1 Tax=Actinomadura macrotermitis TaxID=2585200 RepID=UPI001297A2F4|nr:DUF397 domain-containing protein [Actinomadura macrotermitis]